MKRIAKLLMNYGRVSGAAPAFSPLDISGLVAWYDFSDITKLWQDSARTTPVTADGDPIGAADDKSGNAYHALQGTSAAKPTYKTNIANSLSAAYLDGGDFLAKAFGTEIAQPGTMFAVAKLTAGLENNGVNYIIVDGSETTKRWIFYKELSTTPDRWGLYLGTMAIGATNADANIHYFSAYANGASSQLFVDGASSATGNSGTHNLTGITIGARFDGAAAWWSGHIMESLTYSGALSSANRQSIEAYLADKWT